MTLAQYVLHRTGVPLGAKGSLRNMLRRSLGAGTFAGFWQHWNPIFGYGLGIYVFSPLRRFLPVGGALIATFVVCGALHDLVTTAVRGSLAFFFTPWFLLLGIGVVFGRGLKIDLSGQRWAVRATANLAYISTCLAIVILVRNFVGHWPDA